MKITTFLKPAFFAALLLLISCEENDKPTGDITIEESDPVVDYDGNSYKTVKIGYQIWMAENLKTTHYNDGTPVQSFVYNNEENSATNYGRLYQWAATMRNSVSSNSNPSGVQGISPQGWHIPSLT